MSRKQTIFRMPKNQDHPYVRVDKQFIEVPGLSFRAKGVLLYILSKPDHWKVSVKDIVAHSKDGRDAVYTSLNELTEHGYIQRICHREKGKITGYEYIVTEQAGRCKQATYTVSGSSEVDTQDHTESQETAFTEEGEAEEPPSLPANPEPVQYQALYQDCALPAEPHPGNRAVVSNDFSNKLKKNKTCSSSARDTIFILWEEIFSTELRQQEFDALLKVCSRTTLVRNLCRIEEHHCVASILAPFPFVMKCITSGGYKVPKKAPSSGWEYEKKKSKPLPKAVQRALDGTPHESPYTPEQLEEMKARIQARIRRMREEHPLPCGEVV